MSLSSRIKRAVRRNVHESRQARERREAQAWRQRWDTAGRWVFPRHSIEFWRISGPVTIRFSLDTGRHFRVA